MYFSCLLYLDLMIMCTVNVIMQSGKNCLREQSGKNCLREQFMFANGSGYFDTALIQGYYRGQYQFDYF